MNFDILYYFMNENHNVIEVKRTDKGEDASPEELYYWLYIPTNSLNPERLKFKSMSEETVNGNQINVRVFEDGELRFDKSFAKFQLRTEGHILMRNPVEQVSDNLKDSIQKFLN